MKKMDLMILFLVGAYSGSSYATNESAVICENCNYEQAKVLAMEKAWPELYCHITDGSDVISVDNQSCFSDPRRIVIFNASTRISYPLEVYHVNQGANPHEMMLQVRDRNVAPEIVQLLNVGVDMQQQLNDSVGELATALIGNYYQVMHNASSLDTKVMSDPAAFQLFSSASCNSDRDAVALEKTFDTRAINSAQQYVQEAHRSQTISVINQFQSYFDRNTASLSTVSFNLSKGGAGGPFNVNAEFSITPKTTHFTVLYNTADDLRFFSTKGVGGWSGYPQLVFDIGPNNQGDVTLRLNENYTYISGYTLADFRHFSVNSSPLQVSPCVFAALQQHQPQMAFEFVGGGGVGEPGTGPGTAPGGGVVGAVCERTVIGKVNGVIVLVLTTLVPC